jgi:hypothetical protein
MQARARASPAAVFVAIAARSVVAQGLAFASGHTVVVAGEKICTK